MTTQPGPSKVPNTESNELEVVGAFDDRLAGLRCVRPTPHLTDDELACVSFSSYNNTWSAYLQLEDTLHISTILGGGER